MSEYPKFLPKLDADGKETDEGGIVVQDAEAEAVALANGHIARKSVPPADVIAQPDGSVIARLEYPKHVYRGEGDARVSIVVQNADEETAAAGEGYAPVSAAETPAADEDAGKGKKGKKGAKA